MYLFRDYFKANVYTIWAHGPLGVLGGSWVVVSGVISPLTWAVSIVILLITLLITTHEP